MTDQTVNMPHVDTDERSMKRSLLRGWRRKCPNCGAGPMLKSYLKVNDTCTVCGQELFHHRADDGPAYLTILLVGHLLAPGLHIAFVVWRPEPLTLRRIVPLPSAQTERSHDRLPMGKAHGRVRQHQLTGTPKAPLEQQDMGQGDDHR